ncbi:DUF1716-domain-containing protein [Pleurostoma richardsiae]|uniref:DUF1716-domain-containing protein n=1 Tax=Pleurostoma richardsiae TaxID=41990 RepID=A0AA38RRX5_9PEZI|nr:DUF1716-domain-containing protein [Pleurostoma richardsiae]
MTSVDDLFKNSGLPSKRKLDPVRDPNEIYKSVKLSSNGQGRHARVDAADADNDDDVEAGPSLPPDDDGTGGDDDGDYGPDMPPDDEEGRFFGGGITAQESEILDFVEGREEEATSAAPEKIDAGWLKKTALKFEQLINRNAQQRAKYESEPQKFIQSEADLDGAVRGLSIITEHPELYPLLAELGTAASLASLLAHENTDIAIAAVEIINELTDEDVAATDEQWGALADALLEADLVGLLASNLGRLDETDETDRDGVYYIMGVIENLCSRAATAEQITLNESLVQWLLQRMQKKEEGGQVSQNKQYAAEILAILVQTSPVNRRRLAALDAADAMLQLVATYRRRDPEKGGEEEEYMENLFEALTCLVDEPEGKTKFLEAEGVELCLIMLKEGGKMSKAAALRLLDHAVSAASGTETCRRLVEAGGLKTTFTLFMKKQHESQAATEHLVGIFNWMLRLLPAESAERIRLLAKFVEKDYEKTDKLLRLRREFAARVAAAEEQLRREQVGIDEEERREMADEWFSRRLDAGLFCLQTIDVILAWLVAEDSGARRKIKALLADRDEDFSVIKDSIQEQLDGIDEETEEGKDTREMLTTLVEFLQ